MAGRGRTSKRHTEPHISTPGSIGVEGAEGTGGHGRASRSTTPSRRLACSDLAGGRARRRPEHQRSRKQQARSRIPAAPTAWRAARPGRGAGGWWRGLAGLRADAPSNTSATRRRRCGGRRRVRRAPPYRWAAAGPGCGARGRWQGLAAVPVGGGGAWPGFEPTRRAKLAARTASGRAAAHRHTQRQGPTKHHNGAPGTPAAPRATQQPGTAPTRPNIQKTDIRIGCRPVVELGGFEPPTFSLRTRRATNCAIAPRTQTA